MRLALAVLVWQLINAVATRYRSVRIGGWTPGRWSALLLSVLTIAVALGLVVDLIVSNVGAVSASAPAYEANLLALVARVAVLFGLPHPETLAPLVGPDRSRHLDPHHLADAALVREQYRPGSALCGLHAAGAGDFDRKIDALPGPGPRGVGPPAARPDRAAHRALSVGQDHLQPRHGGVVVVRADRGRLPAGRLLGADHLHDQLHPDRRLVLRGAVPLAAGAGAVRHARAVRRHGRWAIRDPG